MFDIDGVIRDVSGSYRRALQETVAHFSGWRPSFSKIDSLKAEGTWNNDWEASLELIRRNGNKTPEKDTLIKIFSKYYFGDDPEGDPFKWNGFIGNEPLLVAPEFFANLSKQGIRWGFVSGAELPSARFVLKERLGLKNPPLIAMGDAPDKPDPTGLILMAELLAAYDNPEEILYLGDTVADVLTVLNARMQKPEWSWKSIAVAPPHVNDKTSYHQMLLDAGADIIIKNTRSLLYDLALHRR